jgi:hypothetical protein
MYRGEYSAVIGLKTRNFACAQYEFPGCGFISANHSAGFPHVTGTLKHGVPPNDSVANVSDSG